MKITAVQMNSQDDIEDNLAFVETAARQARHDDNAQMIVLPEYFAYLHDDVVKRRASGAEYDRICDRLAKVARDNGLYVHAGSIVEPKDDRAYNTTIAFGPDGEQLARYRKIHLFDFDNPNGTRHRESEAVAPGTEVVTYRAGNLTIGCAICYDIRFPVLFERLRNEGADVIMLPAAFTLQTGKDHWEVLLRARAIETQAYLVAAAQALTSAEGRRQAWGHSMIVDPWGHIVAQASDMVGITTGKVDPAYIARIRAAMPVTAHQVL